MRLAVENPQGGSLALNRNVGCQEPALRSGREAPSSFGRRRRRASRRTRRSVSVATSQAGRGTECARPEALRLPRLRGTLSGIVTRIAETRGDHGDRLSEAIARLEHHAALPYNELREAWTSTSSNTSR